MGGKSAAGGATTAGSAGSSAGDAGNDGSSGEGGNAAPEGGPGPKFSDFVGLNGFIDDDKEKLAAVGNVREYHDWGFSDASATPYPDERLEFSRWEGFWDFDDYYRSLKTAGVTVFPCLQGSVEALGNRMPPIAEAADPSDPASYLAHASFLFQYAARYGSVTVPESALKLADGQVVASGLGSLRYFENGNEPDADWVNS